MLEKRKIVVLVILAMFVLLTLIQTIPAPPPGQGSSPPGLSSATGWTVNGNDVYKTNLGGKVGIGMIDPKYKLDVAGNIHTTGHYIAGSSTTYGNGYIDLSTGTDLSIDSDTIFVDNLKNRVGIGVNNPEAVLDINYTYDRLTEEGWNPGLKLGRASALIWDKGLAENYFFMAHPATGPPSKGDFYAGLTQAINETTRINYVYKIYGQSREGKPLEGTTQFYHNLLVDEKVGIGTHFPDAKLDVHVNSGGAATIGHESNSATGDYAIAMGYGTTAFGDYSIALGLNTTAKYDYSTAFGRNTTAMVYDSTAMGYGTIAGGYWSTAMGYRTKAMGHASTSMGYETKSNGRYSTAMGEKTVANGIHATSMGWGTHAKGNHSTTMGSFTYASGEFSTAMGYFSKAIGNYSTSIGLSTIASGFSSTAMGDATIASGPASSAMGFQTIASGHSSTAMGRSIEVKGFASFGIGLNYTTTKWSVTKDNTMAIMGGNVGIGTVSPTAKLEVRTTGGNYASQAIYGINYGTPEVGYISTGGSFINKGFSFGSKVGVLGNSNGINGTNIGGYFYASNGLKNYGVYSANGKNYFADNVGIGSINPTSPLHVMNLPTYSNNAAAITGGLTKGAFYRTGGDPDLVCVVH
jgi:hypothetical protein